MIISKVKNRIKQLTQPKFTCPLCKYRGVFKDVNPSTGYRKYCRCPNCTSAERNRLQKLVLEEVFEKFNLSKKKALHFAPETFFRSYFSNKFQEYVSSDLEREDVMVKADMTAVPFADDEFDFIFASHVLEHIKDDIQALKEIKKGSET